MSIQADELRKKTYFRLRALQGAVQELGPRVRWATSARFLWNLLRSSAVGLKQQLVAADSNAASFSQVVQSIDSTTDVLHSLLWCVETGSAERVPQPIVSALEHLVSQLVPESRVLVCYDWSPSNYGYLREFLGDLTNNIRTAVLSDSVEEPVRRAADHLPEFFPVIFLPAAERDNVLLHAALAHEIGHGLVEKLGLPAIQVPPELASTILTLSAPEWGDLYELHGRWLRELVADAWAVCLLGPAPLMSLEMLAPTFGPERTHPSSNLRFRVMQQCLRATGFISDETPVTDMEWIAAKTTSAIELSASAVGNPNLPHCASARTWMEQYIDHIAAFVHGKASDLVYTAQRWEDECDTREGGTARRHQLVRRLLYAAPADVIEINGAEIPANLPAIVNAGWTVYADPQLWHSFVESFGEAGLDAEYKANRKLQRLVLKAIDSVNIQHKWGLES